MLVRKRLAVACAVLLVSTAIAAAQTPYWVAPMTTVHDAWKLANPIPTPPKSNLAISRFGDTLTYSASYFRQLQNNWQFTGTTQDDRDALDWMHAAVPLKCWTWQDPPPPATNNPSAHGIKYGGKSEWMLQDDAVPEPKNSRRNIDYALETDRSAVAVIMWGTYDVIDGTVTPAVYKENMRAIVRACTAAGTIPILTTIPPMTSDPTGTPASTNPPIPESPARTDCEAKTVGDYDKNLNPTGARGTFIQPILDLATEEQVPLIDLNKEILDRRPNNTWQSFHVPGPTASIVNIGPGNGVFLSTPQDTDGLPETEEWKLAYSFLSADLYKYGYNLRNWLTLHAIWDVQTEVMHYVPPSGNVAIKVYETARADVPAQPTPGPRVFPIPASAKTDTDVKVAKAGGWVGAELVYDNYAEGLVFSNAPWPPYSSLVTLPIIKPKIVIHSLRQPVHGEPFVDVNEPYTDSNANGAYDAGEPFTDLNGNGIYDRPNGRYDAAEPFTDENGNGVYDAGEPYTDSNVYEPFTDTNGNGTPDAGEQFTDINGNLVCDPTDGHYTAAEAFTDMDGDGARTGTQRVSPDNAFWIWDNYKFYVTQEGTPASPNADTNRFPYRVPRLARSHAEDFMGVLFEFPKPVKAFGIFLPASTNNYQNGSGLNDQNFVKQDRQVYVTVMDESGAPVQMYQSLKVNFSTTYCPFATFIWDGLNRIQKVSIIHDCTEGADKGVSFMDAYILNAPLPGDINLDNTVGVLDLQALVQAWASHAADKPTAGTPVSINWNAAADLNGDGYVNVGDLQILIANWGQSQ